MNTIDDLEEWRKAVRRIPAEALNGRTVEAFGREFMPPRSPAERLFTVHLLHSFAAEYADSTGRRRPVRNAIDRLCGLEGLSYGRATIWLMEHYAELSAETVESGAAETVASAGISAIDQRILRDLAAFTAALDCPFEIWAMNPNDKRKKDGFKICDVNNLDDVRKHLKILKAKNCQGYSIYGIVPVSTETAVIVLDDVENLDDAKAEKRHSRRAAAAYIAKSMPNVYLRTSPGKTQALFRLPYNPLRDYEVYKRLVQEENQAFGDIGLNSLRHFFRLPGFRNTKARHANVNFFVALEGSRRGVSPYMAARAAAMREAMAAGVVRHRAPILPEPHDLAMIRQCAAEVLEATSEPEPKPEAEA